MKPPTPTVGATDTTPYNASDASSDALRLARVGQLEADAARLDWLEEQRVDVEWGYQMDGKWQVVFPTGSHFHGETPRAAIDAARAALESEVDG